VENKFGGGGRENETDINIMLSSAYVKNYQQSFKGKYYLNETYNYKMSGFINKISSSKLSIKMI